MGRNYPMSLGRQGPMNLGPAFHLHVDCGGEDPTWSPPARISWEDLRALYLWIVEEDMGRIVWNNGTEFMSPLSCQNAVQARLPTSRPPPRWLRCDLSSLQSIVRGFVRTMGAPRRDGN